MVLSFALVLFQVSLDLEVRLVHLALSGLPRRDPGSHRLFPHRVPTEDRMQKSLQR